MMAPRNRREAVAERMASLAELTSMSAEPSSSFDPNMPQAPIPSESGTTESPSPISQAGLFYRVDSSRSTFRELWRDTRSPLALIAWLSKLLRIKLPGSVNDPNVVSLYPFLLDDGTVDAVIPPEVRQRFAPVLRELVELGFGAPAYFAINDAFHHSQTFQAVMLHRDGRTVARVSQRAEGMERIRTHFFTEFLSSLSNGGFLWSSSAKAQLLAPAECRLNWNHKATTSQLWVSHRHELATAGPSVDSVVPLRDDEEMLDALERHHETVRDFHLQRGLFSSMQGEDLVRVEALDRNIEQAREGRMRHPEIMAQLERLQNKRTNWASAIIVLIVSIALFVGVAAGAWKWSWEILVVIVGVLLVHEAGHYLAMKMFNYANVRMFFIPFFGAAVSGQNYTAPGWKRVITALMGPLPGIFLAGVVGITGLIRSNDLMTRIGLMAAILNGFQLLPVLPLDGGRVMHTLLFSRNHYLDTVFQVGAGGLLALIGSLAGDRVLLMLGIFMLVSVPTAYKVAKISSELRGQGLGPNRRPPAATPMDAAALVPAHSWDSFAIPMARQPLASSSPTAAPSRAWPAAALPAGPAVSEPAGLSQAAEQSIPQFVAETIIDRVCERFPRLKNPKQIAAMTARIYENLATRPPGIAASIGFALLHGASFVTALVLVVVLALPQLMSWSDVGLAAVDPKYVVDPASIESWYGTTASMIPSAGQAENGEHPDTSRRRGYDVIIASFSTSPQARGIFGELRQRLPSSAAAVLFGQSVIVSLPSDDKSARTAWIDELEKKAEDLLVDGVQGFQASMTLTCMAPGPTNEADMVRRQLEDIFDLPGALCLIPPWADSDRRSEQQRTRHTLARGTYRKLQQAYAYDAPEVKELDESLSRAARLSDKAEYDRLSRQQADLHKKLRIHEIKRIRDNQEEPVDHELVDRYIAIEIDRQNKREAENRVDAVDAGASATRPAASGPGEPTETPEDEAKWEEILYNSFEQHRTELGPLMGQLPLPSDGRRPPFKTMRYSHRYGNTNLLLRHKFIINVTFEDASHGAPALLKWLKKHGCTDFKYEFDSAGAPEFYDAFD